MLQGNGTLDGSLTATLDGGEPFSNAVFSRVSISRIGLYTLQVSSETDSAVSKSVQVWSENWGEIWWWFQYSRVFRKTHPPKKFILDHLCKNEFWRRVLQKGASFKNSPPNANRKYTGLVYHHSSFIFLGDNVNTIIYLQLYTLQMYTRDVHTPMSRSV